MSAYIYVRVSTEHQKQSGAGEAAQIDAMVEHLKRLGYEEEPTIYRDLAVKRRSKLTTRPGLSALLAVLKKGDVLAVMKWDRLGTIREVPQLLQELSAGGIRVVTAQGDDFSSPQGEFMVHTMLNVAQFEVRMIQERITESLQAKKRRGQTYCKRLYGHRPVDGRFVPNEEEQAIVRRIVESVNQKRSLNSIAQELNREGIPAPTGPVWRHSTVKRIADRVMA